jgi:hypothetical protein
VGVEFVGEQVFVAFFLGEELMAGLSQPVVRIQVGMMILWEAYHQQL